MRQRDRPACRPDQATDHRSAGGDASASFAPCRGPRREPTGRGTAASSPRGRRLDRCPRGGGRRSRNPVHDQPASPWRHHGVACGNGRRTRRRRSRSGGSVSSPGMRPPARRFRGRSRQAERPARRAPAGVTGSVALGERFGRRAPSRWFRMGATTRNPSRSASDSGPRCAVEVVPHGRNDPESVALGERFDRGAPSRWFRMGATTRNPSHWAGDSGPRCAVEMVPHGRNDPESVALGERFRPPDERSGQASAAIRGVGEEFEQVELRQDPGGFLAADRDEGR
jgi:hypothetical protein